MIMKSLHILAGRPNWSRWKFLYLPILNQTASFIYDMMLTAKIDMKRFIKEVKGSNKDLYLLPKTAVKEYDGNGTRNFFLSFSEEYLIPNRCQQVLITVTRQIPSFDLIDSTICYSMVEWMRMLEEDCPYSTYHISRRWPFSPSKTVKKVFILGLTNRGNVTLRTFIVFLKEVYIV